MKIKITTSCFGTRFRYSAGDVAEVSDKLGKDLISAGFATEIKSTKAIKRDAKSKLNEDSMDGDNNAVDA